MNQIAEQLGFIGYYCKFPYDSIIGFVAQIQFIDMQGPTLYAKWIYSSKHLMDES